jgi:high-affinity iron transporter
MDFSTALPTFVITLREGVEAALVVGIVMAYLKKVSRTELYIWVFGGIVTGIAISGIVGVLFNAIIQNFGSSNPEVSPVFEPLLEGLFSLAAIAMLSWMLVWMTQQGKAMKGQVEGSLDQALGRGQKAGWGILTLILFAILREGFEVVLFIAAKFQEGFVPAAGAVGGIITASIIGVALFKFGVRINIRAFFKVMGIFLLLIVSGLVISALGHFDTAMGILAQADRKSESLCFFYEHFAKEKSCILGGMVWNLSKVLPDEKFPGIVFKSLFGYKDKLFLVQAIAYLGFLIAASVAYFNTLNGGTLLQKPHQKLPTSPES